MSLKFRRLCSSSEKRSACLHLLALLHALLKSDSVCEDNYRLGSTLTMEVPVSLKCRYISTRIHGAMQNMVILCLYCLFLTSFTSSSVGLCFLIYTHSTVLYRCLSPSPSSLCSLLFTLRCQLQYGSATEISCFDTHLVQDTSLLSETSRPPLNPPSLLFTGYLAPLYQGVKPLR